MHYGERALRGVLVITLICAVGLALVWAGGRGSAEDQPVGRYQVAVPDLVLDTMTGKLTGNGGRMLESPINPAGDEVGRYSVDGYVTAVTRKVGLDVINQPVAYPQLVKAYVVVDTKTGQILRQKTYYSKPLRPGDL